MNYTYRGGDRPLDGFTIKCGIGRGGFGEVYVAESEGGKYVALKLLTEHSELELRGIAQCLNLKHPNLIHLYDLRTDDRGRYWVVMEYVLGDSLARVLDRHPHGLPPSLAKEWGISLARAVGYLHDKLVVHRDLKPANIFIEDGQVKVGDFGLCKRMIGSNPRSAQSQGVGTVYYMAPEIDRGQYTKAIDIYASGVILYEMLTGSVPFTGDSPLEILHRHLTDAPDLTKVPAVFRPVIAKALEKDPAKRFTNMSEFARALEAIPLGDATASPRPTAIPVAPGNATIPAAIPLAPASIDIPARPSGPLTDVARGRLSEMLGALVAAPLVAALCTAPWAIFSPSPEWLSLAQLFLLTSVLSWSALVVGRFWKRTEADTWSRRARMLLVGIGVGLLGFWLEGWTMPSSLGPGDTDVPYREQYLGGSFRMTPEAFQQAMRYVFYFGLACAAFRWWTITERQRKERIRLLPILAMAFWGVILLFLFTNSGSTTTPGYRLAPLVMAVITVQMVAPWAPPPPPAPRRYRLRMA